MNTVCVCERVFVYIHTSLCKCMQDYVQDYYVRLIVEVCKSHWVNRPCQCTRLCVCDGKRICMRACMCDRGAFQKIYYFKPVDYLYER